MREPEPDKEGIDAKDLMYGKRGKIREFRRKRSKGLEPVDEEDEGNKPDAVINPADIQELLAGLDTKVAEVEKKLDEVRDVLKKLRNLLA
jgi:hypothetical protein